MTNFKARGDTKITYILLLCFCFVDLTNLASPAHLVALKH